MLRKIIESIHLALLRRAIRTVEKAGLSAVQIKRGQGAIYIIAANGAYVRYDKVK